MRKQTSTLIKKYVSGMSDPQHYRARVKAAKRFWNATPVNKRAALRKELEEA